MAGWHGKQGGMSGSLPGGSKLLECTDHSPGKPAKTVASSQLGLGVGQPQAPSG